MGKKKKKKGIPGERNSPVFVKAWKEWRKYVHYSVNITECWLLLVLFWWLMCFEATGGWGGRVMWSCCRRSETVGVQAQTELKHKRTLNCILIRNPEIRARTQRKQRTFWALKRASNRSFFVETSLSKSTLLMMFANQFSVILAV